MFEGASSCEDIDGITYLREGNLLTLILKCMKFYRNNKSKIDFVVDQCNTFRFFTRFWVKPRKRIFMIYQLTREIWDIHLCFPFSKLGKLLETPVLKLNRNDPVITISESTKRDLVNIGFNKDKIRIIPIGISFTAWKEKDFYDKEPNPTFIYVGRFAKYKGIDACISAFGEYKKRHKSARLWIVGKKDDEYINQTLTPICRHYNLRYGESASSNDIVFYGFVTDEKKLELMSRAHLLLVPSIREGWGLIITEAAAVGTPSVVYNSSGLIDAVDYGKTGYITNENDSDELYKTIESALNDCETYKKKLNSAYVFSNKFNWQLTGKAFTKLIQDLSG